MKKYILFGAGNFGNMALEDYGADNVAYFADNDPKKQGQIICGKQVISFEKLTEIAKDFQIVISVDNVAPIAAQLRENGIEDFGTYSPVQYRLVNCLGTKAIHGIALYGTGDDVGELIKILRRIGKGALLKCIAAPEESEMIGRYYGSFQVCPIREVPAEVDCYIIASSKSNKALAARLQREVKQGTVINPFHRRGFVHTKQIVSMYSTVQEHTEEEWNGWTKDNKGFQEDIRAFVEEVKDRVPLFELVEIETYNRCNGVCSFCPVNRKIDPRPEARMSWELFESIIGQLEAVDYSGMLSLDSNNEPLLDERIFEFHKYARTHLPKARMHLFTNGTLLTVPKFVELMQYLDEMIIDNYQQQLRLTPSSLEIKNYLEGHPELHGKVTISLRRPDEVLTSRGGDAPNRKQLVSYPEETCAVPFQQMVIRPDGKVSLCCNDPMGRCTLGDLNKQSMWDVWYGPQYQMIRQCLRAGRKNWEHCKFCDTFLLY